MTLGQRCAVVDAEQLGIIGRWFVLNKKHHVVHEVEQLGRDVVERVPHGIVELLRRQLQHTCHPVTSMSPAGPGSILGAETTESASVGSSVDCVGPTGVQAGAGLASGESACGSSPEPRAQGLADSMAIPRLVRARSSSSLLHSGPWTAL